MFNFTDNLTALDELIKSVGENTFIDSLIARLDKEQAEAIIKDIAVENGLYEAV